MIVADAVRGCESSLALDGQGSAAIGSPRTWAGRFDAWLRSLGEGERLRAFCVCSRVIRSATDRGASTIVDDWTWYDFWTVCALHLAGFYPGLVAHVSGNEVTS
jgi:hypothetical protein